YRRVREELADDPAGVRADLRHARCAAGLPSDLARSEADLDRPALEDLRALRLRPRSEKNCRRCPATAAALAAVPGLQSALFSIIDPGYRIPAHRGVTKGIIRAHLGLKVPADRDRCFMRVGDQRVTWREGECVVFDDSF